MKMKREMINPFSPKHPADPEYFVNREEIIQAFTKCLKRTAKIKPRKPDNIAILGDWGIGKTSVLMEFEYIALELSEELNAFAAFIELTPSTSTDFTQFAVRTRDEIERSFRVSDMSLLAKLKKELIPNWRLKTIDLGVVTIERRYSEKSMITSFEDSLRELWNILEKNGIEVAILMLDDLHYLAQKFPDGLYDIRGIFQRLPKDDCNFMLAITGYPLLFEKAREFAEPFTRFFDRYTLDLFDRKETETAILKPIQKSNLKISLDDDVISRIYELTKGHPYFIYFIMQDLVDSKQEGKINLEFFQEHYPKIARHLAREKFSDDLASVSEAEKRILMEMAELPGTFSPSDIKIKNIRRYLKDLVENKAVVVKVERGRYSLYHPLFKEYLLQAGHHI